MSTLLADSYCSLYVLTCLFILFIRFPQSLLPSKQASKTDNELTYPLAGDIKMVDDKEFDDNYLADDEGLDDNFFLVDDKKLDDSFPDLNSYDLADPFM